MDEMQLARPPTTRLAATGLVALLFWLFPASAAPQTGQVVEYYRLDAVGSVRVVTNQQGEVIRLAFALPPELQGKPVAFSLDFR